MFNLFKKKYLPLSEYEESWSIIERGSTLVRVNMGYKDAVGHLDYPIKMGIAVPVEEHNDKVETMKNEIENILTTKLLKNNLGALVAVITALEGERFIEFLSYTKKEGVDFAKLHKDLRDKFQEYDVQMYAETDPKWKAYRSFA